MLARFASFIIALYRKTPYAGSGACRYYPSCSEYAEQAINKHGTHGIFLALMRIIRCNQLFKGGVDLVP